MQALERRRIHCFVIASPQQIPALHPYGSTGSVYCTSEWMRQQFTEYDVWSFQKSQPDCWSWRRTSPDGEVLLECRAAFTSFEDCMEDARRHGYTGSYSVTS